MLTSELTTSHEGTHTARRPDWVLTKRRSADTLMDFGELMESSEQLLANAARRGTPSERCFARRLIEEVPTYCRWENLHGSLMRAVATQNRRERQILVLKKIVLSMVHRKAPFEYLKERRITGFARHQLFAVFYG